MKMSMSVSRGRALSFAQLVSRTPRKRRWLHSKKKEYFRGAILATHQKNDSYIFWMVENTNFQQLLLVPPVLYPNVQTVHLRYVATEHFLGTRHRHLVTCSCHLKFLENSCFLELN